MLNYGNLKERHLIQGLCLFFIVAGILFRLDCFMQNRSLRGDEAAYFICNVSRTPVDILLNRGVNFYSPPAPLGFSFLEKFMPDLFGYHEYGLRFIALISGLLALPFFYFLLSQYPFTWATVFALGLFALSDKLIFFSADMKPYSTDVFLAILIIWMFNRLERGQFILKDTIYFILAAMVSVWLSYPIVFILAGIAVASLLWVIFKKEYVILRSLLIIHCSWMFSFLLAYIYAIYPVMHAGITFKMWEEYFIKDYQNVFNSVQWIMKNFGDVFKDPLGIAFPVLGVLFFFVGAQHLFHKDRRQFFLLISPIVITLVAATLKEYPFTGRVGLFLIPCLLIFISLGVQSIILKSKKISRIGLMIALAIFFYTPLKQISYSIFYGWGNEEGREAICYLKDHVLDGDSIFMNTTARFTYGYYMGYFHINMNGRWVGRIWDGFFQEAGGPLHARCLFERFVSDSHGFLTSVVKYKNKPAGRIYSDQWLNVGNKREWLLLIDPSEDLRNFLRRAFYHQRGRIKEIAFKDACLYLLERQ